MSFQTPAPMPSKKKKKERERQMKKPHVLDFFFNTFNTMATIKSEIQGRKKSKLVDCYIKKIHWMVSTV